MPRTHRLDETTRVRLALHVATLLAAIVVVSLLAGWIGASAAGGGRWAVQIGAYVLLVAIVLGMTFVPENLRWSSLGFERGKAGWQALWALVLLLVLVLAFIGLPLGLGMRPRDLFGVAPTGAMIAATIAYDLIVVGFGEELIFRGYLLERITRLTGSGVAAALSSAVLFGLWHLLTSGNWLQAAMTAGIGLVLAFGRLALPHCSLPSVALAHGLYDVAILLGALTLA